MRLQHVFQLHVMDSLEPSDIIYVVGLKAFQLHVMDSLNLERFENMVEDLTFNSM